MCPNHLEDTNEDLMYCVLASSKVSKNRAAPLIVTLHGLGAGPGAMMTKNALDPAEAGNAVSRLEMPDIFAFFNAHSK